MMEKIMRENMEANIETNIETEVHQDAGNMALYRQQKVKKALDAAISKIEGNLGTFTDKFPSSVSVGNMYTPVENRGWTRGFWTGMLWLAYEYSGWIGFRNTAEIQVRSFQNRLKDRMDLEHHDIGFLYTPSCVAAYKVTGDEAAKKSAVVAADCLIERYRGKGRFISTRGDVNAPESQNLIIDCFMNLPLLYWATEATGEMKYKEAAYNHYKTAAVNVIREDGSTYQGFLFDPESGEPLRGVTHQGYSDNSCWSRGQAWGIYGTLLSFLYTGDSQAVPLSKKLLEYFLNRLPEDGVPYWDLVFTRGNEPRDSSAAAIAACGILELLKHMGEDDPRREVYLDAVWNMMESLMDAYSSENASQSNGLLLHGVYNRNKNKGVDECNIWGDYFYMEALMRMAVDWRLYW